MLSQKSFFSEAEDTLAIEMIDIGKRLQTCERSAVRSKNQQKKNAKMRSG
jgi:hypothetical protein